MSESPLHFLTITEVAALIRDKQVSPVEVTEAMLQRIDSLDGRFQSYATVMADQAMESARKAEIEIAAGRYLGPLHGVPIAVKDLCFTKGVRTMGGTPVLSNHVPDFDATVISKLAAAGSVLLGKLNLTEGAMAGYHPDFPIPVNPWNPEYWTGVSSSGSGVATAAGLCFGSLGSDTGGSIRFPAASCGYRRYQAHMGTGQPLRRSGPGRIHGPHGSHDSQLRRRRYYPSSHHRPRPQRPNLSARTCGRPVGGTGRGCDGDSHRPGPSVYRGRH